MAIRWAGVTPILSLSLSASSTIPLFIAGFPFGGIVAGLAPPDADELASGLQSGEAQLRQPFGDLGDKLFLFGLDAPVI